MPKRLTNKQKAEIIDKFFQGRTVDELSKEFNCTKLTISRNIKASLGENKYKNQNKKNNSNRVKNNLSINSTSENNDLLNEKFFDNSVNELDQKDFFEESQFVEVIPLNYDIDSTSQKDLASVSVKDVNLPNIVYMIVDKQIELKIKYLNEYPHFQFLSKEELDRKTIQIFVDLKNARRFCEKEQKVIKVPNTSVFRIVAPLLLKRGISRIVCDEELIYL